MKSQDIVIMLKLICLQEQEDHGRIDDALPLSGREDPFSVRGLEHALGISKTEVGAAINRCLASGLATKDRERQRAKPNQRNLYNFIIHGLKFVFPAKPGAMTRGLPTAFTAPMLEGQPISGGSDTYVWPYAKGTKRGQQIAPLFKSVPQAAEHDERLYEYLALIDAIRIGGPREATLAAERLKERMAL